MLDLAGVTALVRTLRALGVTARVELSFGPAHSSEVAADLPAASPSPVVPPLGPDTPEEKERLEKAARDAEDELLFASSDA